MPPEVWPDIIARTMIGMVEYEGDIMQDANIFLQNPIFILPDPRSSPDHKSADRAIHPRHALNSHFS
jgi:hypothetical protein